MRTFKPDTKCAPPKIWDKLGYSELANAEQVQ